MPEPAEDGDGLAVDFSQRAEQLRDERRQLAVKLRERGGSVREIAQALNVSVGTVQGDLAAAGNAVSVESWLRGGAKVDTRHDPVAAQRQRNGDVPDDEGPDMNAFMRGTHGSGVKDRTQDDRLRR